MRQMEGDRRSSGESRSTAPPREITSDSLFKGACEVVIRHGDELYRLRVTKQNKLILNK